MAKIYLEETPIYTQLVQEYAAREAFYQHFVKDALPEDQEVPESLTMKTFALRGGGITVYGDPIAPRDA